MNTSIRAMLLTAVVCVVGTGHAEADIFTATVPGLEGVRMDYFGPAHSAPVDFGHGFTTIDKVTIAITATGHTGAAILSDPFLGSFETDVPAGLISLIRSTDGTASTFLGGVGPFTETLGTQQVNRFGSIAHLLGGRAEIFLEFDGLLSFYNIFVYDPPFVDIQSVTVTVEGTSTASMGDPTGDGFVGIEDLNLVLGGWNQSVTPGDVQGGDLSGDGFVGIEDLNVVLGNWNAGTPPAQGVVVPEPMSIAVTLVLCGGALLRRRTRA